MKRIKVTAKGRMVCCHFSNRFDDSYSREEIESHKNMASLIFSGIVWDEITDMQVMTRLDSLTYRIDDGEEIAVDLDNFSWVYAPPIKDSLGYPMLCGVYYVEDNAKAEYYIELKDHKKFDPMWLEFDYVGPNDEMVEGWIVNKIKYICDKYDNIWGYNQLADSKYKQDPNRSKIILIDEDEFGVKHTVKDPMEEFCRMMELADEERGPRFIDIQRVD